MSTKRTVPGWDGYVLKDSQGRDVFYIRKQINGTRYKISTRCRTLKSALKQLERFEAAPGKYSPEGEPRRKAVLLTEKLVEEYLTYCRDVKGNSAHWISKKKNYLAWWSEKVGGLDLRRLSLSDHIKPALKVTPGASHKIAMLKDLYAWLRKEKHLVSLAEDPTFDMLPVPQAKPAQWKKSKFIPKEDFEKARGYMIAGVHRDAITAACLAAGVKPFGPGRMRHTVAQEAIESGADMAAVANFLNHRSPQTMKRFYATLAVAKKVPSRR
jgi:integrase